MVKNVDKETLDFYETYYFTNEEPVPFELKYNQCVINIYPVKVKDYPKYLKSVNVLQIDKNKINDVKVIQMSYLQFLMEVVLKNEMYQQMLYNVLSLSLGDKYDYKIIRDNNKYFLCLMLNEEMVAKVSSKEFNKISDIIIHYNDRTYDGIEISEDLRKVMEEYYSIKFRNQHYPSLEEKKAFVSAKNGMTLNEINQMSYRYFDFIYDSCVSNDLYFAKKMIQASEKYKVDEDVVHPLFDKKASKFDFLRDAKSFEDKVASQGRL